MKFFAIKRFLIFALGLIFFLPLTILGDANYSFAGYPGECTVTIWYEIWPSNTVQKGAFDSIDINDTGFLAGIGSSFYGPGTAYYGSCYHGFYEDGWWHLSGHVGGWFAIGACHNEVFGTFSTWTPGKTCGDIPRKDKNLGTCE